MGFVPQHDRHLRPSERRRLRDWKVQESSREVCFFRVADGWELALSVYGDPARTRRRHPVLLCHGLGSNRLSFDIDHEHSLAAWLVEQGFDVYSIDLRGHGLSERPGPERTRDRWGFVEYCELDVPAAIDAVLSRTGAERLHFVGHSMGGILLYAHAAVAEPRIRSGITIGSSLDYSDSATAFRWLARLAPLSHLLPEVPVHWPALLSASASRGGRTFVDPMLVNPDNVELEVYRKLAANVMHPVASRVLRELALAIDGRGMRDSGGRRYVDLLARKGYSFPILALAGVADLQCPPAAARRFGTAFAAFGRPHGHRADYGHDDLIMGLYARDEVWPRIGEWLADHD
jgi:pimeloyl-ACP methyl ester carboxylesterase